MINEVIKKRAFDINSDRLGPDCLFTHWKLYFKSSIKKICKQKFNSFSEKSEFSAGTYAITCSKISIGENVIIRPNTMIFTDPRKREEDSIFIERDVVIGSGVHIYVANHKYNLKDINIINQGHYAAKSVLLQEGCWIEK